MATHLYHLACFTHQIASWRDHGMERGKNLPYWYYLSFPEFEAWDSIRVCSQGEWNKLNKELLPHVVIARVRHLNPLLWVKALIPPATMSTNYRLPLWELSSGEGRSLAQGYPGMGGGRTIGSLRHIISLLTSIPDHLKGPPSPKLCLGWVLVSVATLLPFNFSPCFSQFCFLTSLQVLSRAVPNNTSMPNLWLSFPENTTKDTSKTQQESRHTVVRSVFYPVENVWL